MKIPFNGREVEGRKVDFSTRKEDFNEYMLENGTILKMKLVVTQVIELVGEKNPDGGPAYFIKSQNVVAPLDLP